MNTGPTKTIEFLTREELEATKPMDVECFEYEFDTFIIIPGELTHLADSGYRQISYIL